jgi:hypothetical protein
MKRVRNAAQTAAHREVTGRVSEQAHSALLTLPRAGQDTPLIVVVPQTEAEIGRFIAGNGSFCFPIGQSSRFETVLAGFRAQLRLVSRPGPVPEPSFRQSVD